MQEVINNAKPEVRTHPAKKIYSQPELRDLAVDKTKNSGINQNDTSTASS